MRQPRAIMGLVLVAVASFTHIETTLFFVGLMFILSVALSGFPKRIAIVAIAVVLPAAIIYIIHLLQLVSLTGYSLPVYTLEPILFWFEIFGPLLPLAILGLTIVLPPSAYQRLQCVSANLKFLSTPIFVYNDFDTNAGGLGDLYDNWVGAIVGTHLSYLGSIDYLVQVQQTPYSNIVSRLHSAIFEKELRDVGITSRAVLLSHPIIIVADFYNPYPLPTYYAIYFNEVSKGVFVGNTTRLAAINNVTISLAASIADSSGP